jgi:hypothetical protein
VKLVAGHRGPFGKQKLVRKNFKRYTKTSSRNTDLFERNFLLYTKNSSRNTDLFERNF